MWGLFVKRNIVALLSVVLIVSLAACTKNTNNTATSGAGSSVVETPDSESASSADPFGKYSPPIEVTGFKAIGISTKFENGETIDDNRWMKAYEDELGIKLKWTWAADEATQYYNKLNVSIASGEYADFFFVNSKQFKMLANDGQLADLTDAYENYASPLVKKYMNAFPQGFESGKLDGKLLGLSPQGDYAGQSLMIWIRQDWMQKLGLQPPKTMDDFVKIADAFAKQDPDNNGKNDTYGLAVTNAFFGGFQGDYLMGFASLEGFFNGYHAYPSIWIKDDSGKLVYGSVQPQMKDALKKLQEMFKAGLIDKEFGVKDPGKVAEDINKNKIGMSIGMEWNTGWPFDEMLKTNPEAIWKPYPLVSVDDQPALAENPWPISGYMVASKDSKNPEALIKMLNLYVKYVVDENRSKEDSNKFEKSQDGSYLYSSYALAGMQNPDLAMNDFYKLNTALKNKSDATLRYTDGPLKGEVNSLLESIYNQGLAYVEKGDVSNGNHSVYIQKMADDGSYAILKHYRDNNLLMINQMPGVGTDTLVQKKSTLLKLEQEVLTKIIMGVSPLDDFDKFVADWKKLGGDQITKEVNDTYNN
ncbi:extracellular solute-binding protein [Paenibacillus nasutitermitis]|uniref:Aldouronate transport system substrate-binding protein n=1 Tax=Paenibacillus nasutitermitis TaxID=1652958 RepID=A0A916YMH1_9BACL|nr:extracellular solute-binding protein [Paenibacillus nasutitermitis]GGD51536.1 hypothetical protein GCM10010911_06370 [Paenibacillus nasutitermitis]